MTKLNDEVVFDIKKRLKEGAAQAEIAEQYGVSISTISRIKRNILHKKIVTLSEEFSRGYEKGYIQALKDLKK